MHRIFSIYENEQLLLERCVVLPDEYHMSDTLVCALKEFLDGEFGECKIDFFKKSSFKGDFICLEIFQNQEALSIANFNTKYLEEFYKNRIPEYKMLETLICKALQVISIHLKTPRNFKVKIK